MHRFDFEKGKSKAFPMSFGLGDKSRTSKRMIAPVSSRMTFNSRSHESFHHHQQHHHHHHHHHHHPGGATEIILVAINATKSLTRHALEWTLSNAAQPGDRIVLLALLPATPGWKFWKFTRFSPSRERTRIEEAKQSCQFMIEQLQSLCDAKKVQASVKIISNAEKGAATSEARKIQATWVILDRNLKREEKRCSELLHCNLVIVDRYNPKVLRLNLKHSPKSLAPTEDDASSRHKALVVVAQDAVNTPSSSPDVGAPFTPTDRGNSSCSESSTSPFSSTESYQRYQRENSAEKPDNVHDQQHVSESDSDDHTMVSRRWRGAKSLREHRHIHLEGRKSATQPAPEKVPAVRQRLSSHSRSSTSVGKGHTRQGSGSSAPKLALSDLLTAFKSTNSVDDDGDAPDNANLRKAVSLPIATHSPLEPPPLCSICQHKAPVFGRPPREFTFRELELATGGFSQANFLAEGGFGSVHRGILPEGQVVAVKQHKLASAQGDMEFCSEVEVLSCAQHRNVVMLIGYCMENNRRLLVYEFICNSSLDSHLYGRNRDPLEWKYRQRVAVGAARGLRYLHEECRVGCIVHRDMRPNNILLTHDFEPMVGDFGLARWQPDGKLGVETRVIGTFGYLAPEYTQSGQITEKADVYSFGIVLLELVTGRKAIDISRPKGEQCLTEWARPLLRKQAYQELVDPRLGDAFEEDEVRYMLHAAFLCISRDPSMRPRMSQVLRILEGEMTLDVTPTINSSQDGSLSEDDRPTTKAVSHDNTRRSTSALPSRKNRYTSSFRSGSEDYVMTTSRKLSFDELKAAYHDKLNHRRLSYGDAL